MPLVETVRSLLASVVPDRTTYVCTACGESHESAKSPSHARCPGCFSRNVEHSPD